ncbi:3-deoxy-7-phosphoheptulonate synthase [Nocardia blacklockiae]|uniref:3-deoxy-7-phosphoheptulonate synthase n=1 Tax=Nocardia blacklockiae TaxID=480036 RepID=UPI001895CA70|nr:3-deoxy-7-phosphoheptulonate synthase [Nocardia blacklockiae]MBF6174898.1 3-deoxy-7-phosphoheptulonate synthase [Nocardia blacklockiae]
MTITHSVPASPGDSSPGDAGVRSPRDEIARFAHPLTRMLLASDGFTMPVLEAILRTELEVRVLRQDDVAAGRMPATVTDALQVSGSDRVIVRRSCLIDPDMVTVSVNHVVTVSGPAAATGVDDVQMPIGYSLVSRGVSQRRQVLRAGVARWPDGRLCATKAYIITLADRPLCYIRESFNPDVIPPAGAHLTEGDPHWADEPDTPEPTPADLTTAPRESAAAQDEPPQGSVEQLRTLPPLVDPSDCETLTADLDAAARGQAFVLHLGDGGGHLDCDTRTLAARRALIHAATAVLTHGLGTEVRVVPISHLPGRLGTLDDDGRTASDPLLETYFRAAAALNYWRGQQAPVALSGDLLREVADRFAEPATRDLMREVAGLLPLAASAPTASRELFSSITRLHISHEAPTLWYGAALTRGGPDRHWWDCSTQLVWIGDRVRNAQGRRVFAARIRNPVAVTITAATTPHEVERLCQQLNPDDRPGRLTLVARLGDERVTEWLPELIGTVAARETPVCWMCDPTALGVQAQHGGGQARIDGVTAGIREFLRVCRATGTVPGGLHLECPPGTGEFTGSGEWQVLRCVVTAMAELRAT